MDIFKYVEGFVIEILGYFVCFILVDIFISVLYKDVVGMLIKCVSDISLEGIEIRRKIVDRIKI